MNSVGSIKTTVKVQTLIDALVKHSAEHVVEYTEAQKVFEVKYLEAAKNALKDAKAGKYDNVVSGFGLIKPKNVEKDYGELVTTLRAMAVEELELSLDELNCFINNSWDWVVNAKSSNSLYYAAAAVR